MKFDPISPSLQPSAIHPPYGSTVRRGPRHAPVVVPAPAAVIEGVHFAAAAVDGNECDLLSRHCGT